MAVFRQHAEDGSLNDINRFLGDVDRFFDIDHWQVGGLEISGGGAAELEALCGTGHRLSDAEFRRMYRDIFQTIWGRFALEASGQTVAVLEAIDSSYWDVQSTDERFVKFMVDKYGVGHLTSRSSGRPSAAADRQGVRPAEPK